MNDTERQALADHARELLDLGTKWEMVVYPATPKQEVAHLIWVELLLPGVCHTFCAHITHSTHAAWLAARAEPHPCGFLTHGQEPLADDAHIAPVVEP